MNCPRALDVQACLDGELDAVSAAEVERHTEECTECGELRVEIEAIRRLMRDDAPYHRASDLLRVRVRRILDREAGGGRPTGFWKGVASGGVAVAIAASLMLLLFRPSTQDEIAGDVVAAHLRSLMGTHLVDVASSNHHTVKPWFSGRADIAPPVADYAGQGFKLVGGRVDYVHGERAAVVVYRHGAHVVDLFVWHNDGAAWPGMRTKNGYNLLAWAKDDLFFCAVSDAAPEELKTLRRLIEGST